MVPPTLVSHSQTTFSSFVSSHPNIKEEKAVWLHETIPTYHVQLNYYKYRTELALMIHKYIPYSAYQVKTVICCQPPLNI